MPMKLRHGRYELRGWYVALCAVWALAGLPAVVILGIGFGGVAGLFLWLLLNALLFAPIMLAPYGIQAARSDPAP